MHKALTTNVKSNEGDDDVWDTDADFEVWVLVVSFSWLCVNLVLLLTLNRGLCLSFYSG